jgi:3-hydroxymyristoyl/3-hydroxydecanoyl-(acyl carrier protein) dehydratase
MTAVLFRGSFCIGADHAALPGHFPGRPVVPGVVLLDRVAAALAQCQGRSLVGLPQVKFLQPLLPGQEAELTLSGDAERIRFSIVHASALIATGSIEAAA